jgi:RimJ/RimL family protein N-acetyltransferase
MDLSVREMHLEELGLVIDYFHQSTAEHLDQMGVDPSRLPAPDVWRERIERDYARPIDQRERLYVAWLSDNEPVGFSTCDKIVYGQRANMHLHIVDPDQRRRGLGAEYVRRTVEVYFDRLKLQSLFCEPNALNVAPNRTLQKAGFKYLKTYMTVPGPLNFRQPVTRWVVER